VSAYYNEIDAQKAAWLRELIAQRAHRRRETWMSDQLHDVRADDLRGYSQCHFFAGVGIWSYALRLAGWEDEREVWTGSCPCQPFSAAGKGEAFDDERHLWPEFFRLIEARRPVVCFGEQVSSIDGLAWFDAVQLTWITRITPAGFSIPAQRASEPRTEDSVCIGWPTPNARTSERGWNTRASGDAVGAACDLASTSGNSGGMADHARGGCRIGGMRHSRGRGHDDGRGDRWRAGRRKTRVDPKPARERAGTGDREAGGQRCHEGEAGGRGRLPASRTAADQRQPTDIGKHQDGTKAQIGLENEAKLSGWPTPKVATAAD
jgi:DNA (cytosine-5)-methyltransferase 1